MYTGRCGYVGHAESSGGLPAAPQTPLPLLTSLTKAIPSPLLQWQLLDVLYAYCFLMRLYNGDPESDPQVVSFPGQLRKQLIT